jgi:hypothetical protein
MRYKVLPALFMIGVATILISCGDISLGQLLEKQASGELGITPAVATINRGATIEIAASGGFTPYTYSATDGSIDENGAVTYFTAPDFETDVTITVVDGLSSRVTATVHVSSSTGLSFPEAMTITIGENTGYVVATGGTPPYLFRLEGEGMLEFHPLLSDRVKYHAKVAAATTALVRVEDSDGTQRTLTVTVVE